MTVPRVLQEATAIADQYDEEHPETAPTRPRVASKWPALRAHHKPIVPCYCGHLVEHHDMHGCRIMISGKQVCPCDSYNENRLDEFPDVD